MLRKLIAGLACCWMASAAPGFAATLDGVTLPDSYPVDGQRLVLNGLGARTYTIFNVKGYVAGLYLAQPSHDPKAIFASTTPKVIVLQFLHQASKADVEKEYRAGEAINCGNGDCDPADKPDFEHLITVAPGVKVGDITTYIFTSRGVRVLANNVQIDDIANRDLAFRLLSGFIGAHPPSEDLRQHMLGLN